MTTFVREFGDYSDDPELRQHKGKRVRVVAEGTLQGWISPFGHQIDGVYFSPPAGGRLTIEILEDADA